MMRLSRPTALASGHWRSAVMLPFGAFISTIDGCLDISACLSAKECRTGTRRVRLDELPHSDHWGCDAATHFSARN